MPNDALRVAFTDLLIPIQNQYPFFRYQTKALSNYKNSIKAKIIMYPQHTKNKYTNTTAIINKYLETQPNNLIYFQVDDITNPNQVVFYFADNNIKDLF